MVLVILLLVLPIMGQSLAAQDANADTTRTAREPRKALVSSIIIGGGQAYNRAWLKMVGLIAAEIYFVNKFQENRDNVEEFHKEPVPVRTTLTLPYGINMPGGWWERTCMPWWTPTWMPTWTAFHRTPPNR
ncbi:MAG: hypothetical protein IIC41_02235 [Candidatus Marinimicrobia bacterium]|nr:hypothetical protein [Candidatus Neomarinimicrobiota bacterium]